jgi:hypothetical protein
MNLLQYLLHRPQWHKLPPLPRHYSTEYTPRDVDPDTALLMSKAHTRCPQAVALLLRKSPGLTPHELAQRLHRRQKPRRLGSRAIGLVRRALGLSSYDPMREIARQHRRTGRR